MPCSPPASSLPKARRKFPARSKTTTAFSVSVHTYTLSAWSMAMQPWVLPRVMPSGSLAQPGTQRYVWSPAPRSSGARARASTARPSRNSPPKASARKRRVGRMGGWREHRSRGTPAQPEPGRSAEHDGQPGAERPQLARAGVEHEGLEQDAGAAQRGVVRHREGEGRRALARGAGRAAEGLRDEGEGEDQELSAQERQGGRLHAGR